MVSPDYLTPVGAALGGHVPVEAKWGGRLVSADAPSRGVA